MALLQIFSENPDLSYLIQKNPNSGLFMKSVKQGVMFGYFPKEDGRINEQKYIIYFKDASDQISYKRHEDESFEYLNASKYNNARFINDAIQEVLHAAREKASEKDVPSHHEILVNLVETQFKTIDIFRRYFPEVGIASAEISKDNYRILFRTQEEMPLQKLLQLINLFSIFAALNSDDYIFITEDMIRKYVRLANELDAPYFIKYLIKIRMVRSGKKFENLKKDLEQSNRYKIQMVYGDTHDMRIQWIRSILNKVKMFKEKEVIYLERSIVDIGTGIDYRYLKIFAPILQSQGLKYYAIERDYDARERIKAGLRNRALEDTVELFESIEEFLDFYKNVEESPRVDVICTEVLEHNEFNAARKIVNQICDKIDFEKFIITVPNSAFNVHYGLDGKFRHDDHKWEGTIEDVQRLAPPYLNWVISGVGDMVDDVPVTHGLVIFK